AACRHFSVEFGGGHWTPEGSDRQDRVYVDFATDSAAVPPLSPDELLPSVSVVLPCCGNHPYLEETLQSVLNQGYPRLETVAVGRGFVDSIPDAIQKYRDQILWGRATPGCGAAQGIGEGLARASGEVVGWLQPGDLLTPSALATIGRAFADDPDLDLVFANAAYIDVHGRPVLADHGTFRSGFCYGTFEKRIGANHEFAFTYAVPQPTFFFRRRLLESHGFPDPSYPLTYDYELFVRYARSGKI